MEDRQSSQFSNELPRSDIEGSEPLRPKMESLDDMLPHVGDFGRYQWLLLLSLIPYTFTYAVLYFGQFFITLTPVEHWCHIEEWGSLQIEEKINKSIPSSLNYPYYDTCHRWNNSESTEDKTIVRCTSWDYNLTTIPYISLAAELDWVCDRSYLISTAQSIYFCGSIVGGLFFGWLADHRGRIPALVVCNGVALLATIATSYADSFWNFALIRFFTGLAFDNCINIPLIIVMEYMAVNKRSLVVNGAFGFYFAAATTILPWIAYYTANWRVFCYITAVPLLSALITPWILPESARWYLATGMTDKVVEKLRRIAKFNKKTPDPMIYEIFVNNVKKVDGHKQSATLLDLFRTPRMAKHTLLVTLFWSLTALTFDAHVYSLKLLPGSVFVSFSLASVTELPAGILLILTLDRWGRRLCGLISILSTAVCSFLLIFITTGIFNESSHANECNEINRNFPINDDKSLLELDKKLEDKKNVQFKKDVIQVLLRRGGNGFGELTNNIMSKILTNSFALSFSYVGRQNKKSFAKHALCQCVISAVCASESGITEKNVERKIGTWLANAHSRLERAK